MIDFLRRYPSLCVVVFLVPVFRLAYYGLNWLIASGYGAHAVVRAMSLLLFGPGLFLGALCSVVLPMPQAAMFHVDLGFSFAVWFVTLRYALLGFFRKFPPDGLPPGGR